MNNNQPSLPRPRRHRRPGLFWPIILIGVGVIFLLSNLGVLPANPWPLLWKLWPLVLVAIGLDILLGRRSILGAVLSVVFAVLIIGSILVVLFLAQSYPEVYSFGLGELHSQYVTYPLGEIRQAEVNIEFPGGPGRLFAMDDSSNLIEGDLRYYGDLTKSIRASDDTARVRLNSRFRGFGPTWWDHDEEKWLIGLNPRVEYDLILDAGSGDYEFDLRQFDLRSLELDGGSGRIELTLPEVGQYRFELRAGSGDIDIHVPEGVVMRVEYDAGSGDFTAPALTRVGGRGGDGTYESEDFSGGEYSVTIELDGGSGDVTIR